MQDNPKGHLIIALDVDSLQAATKIVKQTREFCGTFKIGLELFSSCGPAAIEMIKGEGADVFLDLKLHDIPNTVASAIKQALRYRVRLLTLHALGGPHMLERAVATIHEHGPTSTQLLAVSVLTHHDDAELKSMGFGKNAKELALDLLAPAQRLGIPGCVCSPREASSLREAFGPNFVIVCPGVRSPGEAQHDQSRTASPAEAIAKGADYIVVGRPITQHQDPKKAAQLILNDIREGLHAKET